MTYLGSLLIYGGNAIFVYFSVKFALENKKSKHIYFGLLFLAVLIPSILGGLRYGIGTDYFVRYLPDYQILEDNIFGTTRVEFGFEMIGRIMVFFNLGFQFMLFTVQVLTNSLVLASLIRYKDEISPQLAMFFYMLLYYQCSYNLVRQCLSMAIIFYALKYVESKKFVPFAILCLVATSIHFTAILSIVVYFLANIWTNQRYRYIKWMIYIVLLSIIFYFESYFNILNRILPIDYYSRYIPSTNIEGISAYFFVKWFLYLVPGTVLIYCYTKKSKEKDPKFLERYRFFLAFTICGFLLSITSYMDSKAFFRISYYFNMGLIYLIPRQCEFAKLYLKFGNIKYKVRLFSIFAVAVMIVIWYYEYFVRGQSMTVPYQWIFG